LFDRAIDMTRISIQTLVVLAMVTTASAQSSEHLAPADVVAEALNRNPEITAAQKRYEAASQRPVQERGFRIRWSRPATTRAAIPSLAPASASNRRPTSG